MTDNPTNNRSIPSYTDILAAQWMQKHFGMQFISENMGDDKTSLVFNVHPESLHILEPQQDDLGFCHNLPRLKCYNLYHFNGDKWTLMKSTDTTLTGFLEPQAEVRIIAREGIPFMWPTNGKKT